jgi:hypothetical protein
LLHTERIPGAYRVDGEWRLPLAAVKEYQAKRSRRVKPAPRERAQSEGGAAEVTA